MTLTLDPQADILSGLVPPARAPGLVPPPLTRRVSEVLALADVYGVELHPWQLFTLCWALAEDDDGDLLYSVVCALIARQCGKTTLGHLVAGDAMMRGMTVAWTAQDRNAARRKWLEGVAMHRQAFGSLLNVRLANGSEECSLDVGGSISVITPSDRGPRGYTFDLVLIDEAFRHPDDFIGSIEPTMAARANAQLWLMSNAGDHNSTMLHHFRDVESSGVCWVEWSAPADADPASPEAWRAAIPTLDQPRGITSERVRSMQERMPPDVFRREILNQWAPDEVLSLGVIDPVRWDELAIRRSRDLAHDQSSRTLGVSISRDRDHASIAEASVTPEGRVLLEVHDSAAGPVGWVLPRLRVISQRHGAPVALDAGGPSGTLVYELEQRNRQRRPLIKLRARQFAQAAAMLSDLVEEGNLTHVAHDDLDAAVAGAGRRELAAGWAWSTEDPDLPLTALEAASVAVWAAKTRSPTGLPGAALGSVSRETSDERARLTA